MTAKNALTTIHYFPGDVAFAEKLCKTLGWSGFPIETHQFPDGESLIRVHPKPGPKAFVLRSFNEPNEKIFPTLCAADALRRAGANRVGLIAPYLAYLRQDRLFQEGEALSQQVIANVLGVAFDEILTLEAHLHRIQKLSEIFSCKALSISAAPAIADWLRKRKTPVVVVGPDEESEPWVRAIGRLAELPYIIGRKHRHGDRRVSIDFPSPIEPLKAVIVDDIASSGATIAVAAKGLAKQGVKEIDAAVVHPIFARGALRRIKTAGVNSLVSGDSIPDPTNQIWLTGLIAAKLSHKLRSH
jgi:ribose-phosphate pyrophosphokinase